MKHKRVTAVVDVPAAQLAAAAAVPTVSKPVAPVSTPSTSALVAPKQISAAGLANRVKGMNEYVLAGRPTQAQFVQVYGPKGGKYTWEQRRKLGVGPEDFQTALAAGICVAPPLAAATAASTTTKLAAKVAPPVVTEDAKKALRARLPHAVVRKQDQAAA